MTKQEEPTRRRTASQAVSALLAQRRFYAAQAARLEIVPGREPLIGVATANESERWRALTARVAWLDEQIAAIREAVAA